MKRRNFIKNFIRNITIGTGSATAFASCSPVTNFSSESTANIGDNIKYVRRFTKSNLDNELNNQVITPYTFGAVGDGSTDDTQALRDWYKAIKTNGVAGYLPSADYAHSGVLDFDGNRVTIFSHSRARLVYTGTSSYAVKLTGNYNWYEFGRINGGNATNAIIYGNLKVSRISLHAVSGGSHACILHDRNLATNTANGNTKWEIDRIEANGTSYGVLIENPTSSKLEGELWYITVIFSAEQVLFQVGDNVSNQTIRWNEYRIAPDSQGISSHLVNMYQNENYIEIQGWAPAKSYDFVFQDSVKHNFITIHPGISDEIAIYNKGNNRIERPYNPTKQVIPNSVWSFLPDHNNGVVSIYARDSGFGQFTYDLESEVINKVMDSGIVFDTTTGPLSGTTGKNGKITVSVDNKSGQFYIENRTTLSRKFSWTELLYN